MRDGAELQHAQHGAVLHFPVKILGPAAIAGKAILEDLAPID